MPFGVNMIAGDTAPVLSFNITDPGNNPLNLAGCTITFQLIDYYSGDVVINATATKIQSDADVNTWGQVAYYWQAGDTTNLLGLYRAWFIVNAGQGPSHYPSGDQILVLISAAGGVP